MTRRTEDFKPIRPPQVGIYTCGPTVYQFAHIGNLRTYIFEDLLRRVLEWNDLAVKHVMNITDVGHLTSNADEGEDKMELSARAQSKSAWELAEFYAEAFLKDVDRLNILRPHAMPKATDHIPEQIALTQRLEQKGFTYRTSDGIYFDVSKFPQYGKLSGQRLEEKSAGARVEVNPEKRHPADFALWKFTPPGVQRQMEWDSPWGRGFPGWHIECSAMSVKYLGQPFDIHCGGVDHISVHHPNEMAQSEAAAGKPLANYWLHGEFMLVDGRRMGKSEGNAFLIDDLIQKGFDPLAFRYLCLNTHYRIPLNFTWDGLQGAQRALERLREHVRNYQSEDLQVKEGKLLAEPRQAFTEAVSDDLNLPEALGIAWTMLRSGAPSAQKLATLLEFDKVLGLRLAEVAPETLEIPLEVQALVAQREAARAQRDFKEADRLRSQIHALGFEVEDTAKGPSSRERWPKKDV